jgi:uncharacterized FAD-dependent dehydrogenase
MKNKFLNIVLVLTLIFVVKGFMMGNVLAKSETRALDKSDTKSIGVEETKKLIDYTDQIYLDFGADTHLEGVENQEQIEKIYNKAKKEGITLINIPIRHLGTEKAHELYKNIEFYLEENGINMLVLKKLKN